jgi:hypothetical protein
MKIKCPLAGEECQRKVEGYDFEGLCCGKYKECVWFRTFKSSEIHPASVWPDHIDKWKARFK